MRPTRVFSTAFGIFIFTVVFAGTIPLGAQTDLREAQGRNGPISDGDDVPLKNWVVPLPAATLSELGTISPMAVPSAASHLITMVPCRIVDTRDPDGPYGGPKMAGTRTFDIDNGPCAGIPPNASAYSLSIAVTATTINGSYLTMWPTGSPQPGTATITWNEGLTLTNAAIIPAGTGGAVNVFAASATHLIIDINGYFVEGVVTNLTAGTGLTGGGTGSVSVGMADGGVGTTQLADGAVTDVKLGTITAAGKVANSATTATSANTANAIVARDGSGDFSARTVTLSGNLSLPPSSAVAGNILRGSTRLFHTTGDNIFLGINAGNYTVSGNLNTVIGSAALQSISTGAENTASGGFAMQLNTTGNKNSAIGRSALSQNTTGNSNIGVGYAAGRNITTGNNNIAIGNTGVATELNTIRIGRVVVDAVSGAVHTRAFLAGVSGVASASGGQVLINSSGQLGTTTSSASVKRDIAAMGEKSSALMNLRPVSFFYRDDAVGIRQYGLIAEEVAEVMPELVQFSPEGKAETVRYHFLAPLLLSEMQKQQQTIEAQRLTNEEQRNQIIELRREKAEQITLLEGRLDALEEQSRSRARLEQSTAVQQRMARP